MVTVEAVGDARQRTTTYLYDSVGNLTEVQSPRVYDADKLFASGENLAKARSLYEAAWKLYATMFDKYPDLMDNAEAQDLIDSVGHYRDLLGQLDEPFPSSFPLWSLLDKHQKGQQIRDQVKLLQGSEPTTEKKEEAKPDAK